MSEKPPSAFKIENEIVSFYKYCVKQHANEKIAAILLNKLIQELMYDTSKNNIYLSKLFKIIYQIRDIEYGLGNRDMAYMMIHVWSKYHLTMAKIALKSFVTLSGFAPPTEKPYGSWKDIKYFCQYIMKKSNNNREPMLEYAIELICNQIRDDYTCAVYGGEDSDISLCARWVPRETSRKFGWLYKLIALKYIPDYHLTARTRSSLDRAYRKTYREFSKVITGLNRRLDTAQIKMCANQWSVINHTKSTCLTVIKNRAAFLNSSKRRGTRMKDDRIQCAENFRNYIKHIENNKSEYCGDNNRSNNNLCDIVKNAIRETESTEELNMQWSKLANKCSANFANMVCMVDMSASMCMEYSIPLYAALGLGIAIAEKSVIGRRVLSFSVTPSWISLESCNTFSECISKLTDNYMTSCSTTHIYMALTEILNVCVDKKLSSETVSNLVLVIFTDMDLKIADVTYHIEMIQRIREKYEKSGYASIPHILFWNVYQTNAILSYSKNRCGDRGSDRGSDRCSDRCGDIDIEKNWESQLFPKIEITKAVTIVNGFNKQLLNAFIKKGMPAFNEMTNWKMLSLLLDNDRYCMVDDFFE